MSGIWINVSPPFSCHPVQNCLCTQVPQVAVNSLCSVKTDLPCPPSHVRAAGSQKGVQKGAPRQAGPPVAAPASPAQNPLALQIAPEASRQSSLGPRLGGAAQRACWGLSRGSRTGEGRVSSRALCGLLTSASRPAFPACNPGYVVSIMGRRRLLPGIRARDHRLRAQAERQAVNFVVQGTQSPHLTCCVHLLL